MEQRIAQLRQEIRALVYRVDTYGDIGSARELEGLRAELRTLAILQRSRSPRSEASARRLRLMA